MSGKVYNLFTDTVSAKRTDEISLTQILLSWYLKSIALREDKKCNIEN